MTVYVSPIYGPALLMNIIYRYGPGQEGATVLLPGFAIIW